jgi:hypothetical protein
MRVLLKITRATPPMRKFATLLISNETVANVLSGTKTPAGLHVSEKLRLHLSTFMGRTGFHALVSRSLALSAAEVPWLRTVRVNEDGSLEGVEELQGQLDPDEFLEGKVVLLAQMLGLLVAFIGENLTVRLVREVWPKVPLKGLGFGKGKKNEKTK